MSIKATPRQAGSGLNSISSRKTMPKSKPIRENQDSTTGSFAPDKFSRAGAASGRPVRGLGQHGSNHA